MVMPLDGALRGAASGIAQKLRRAGRSVDLVLEGKKMKWAFKVRARALACVRACMRARAELPASRPPDLVTSPQPARHCALRTACCVPPALPARVDL